MERQFGLTNLLVTVKDMWEGEGEGGVAIVFFGQKVNQEEPSEEYSCKVISVVLFVIKC